MAKPQIFVHIPSDIPKGEHWAIIESRILTIPGDERSRTNPGHGFPASTEQYISYEAFLNEDDFKEELLKRLGRVSSRDARGLHVIGDEYVLKLDLEKK